MIERDATDALERLMKGRTVIAIAHRLSTIRDADQIMVISGGSVAEMGSHDELMATDGIYAALHAAQFNTTSKRETPDAVRPPESCVLRASVAPGGAPPAGIRRCAYKA